MGNISLVNELLGLAPRRGERSVVDFAAAIAASNGMLIPLDLLVQARLSFDVDFARAELLQREYRSKSRLLDADRPIVACVCDILPDAAPGGASAATPAALAACIAALAPAHIPRVLAFGLGAAPDAVQDLLLEASADELIVRVPLNSDAATAGSALRALRRALDTHAGTRLLAVLFDSGGAPPSPAHARLLARELARGVDVVCSLPLVTSVPRRRAHFVETTAELEALDLERVAPGLHAHRLRSVPARPLPWLTRIMAHLPQADVLGLGPAAHSRFNEIHFHSHADPRHYADDVARGGYGIEHTYASSPVDQFVEATLVKLASGSVVDTSALAVRCQCASPHFLEACGRLFDALRASGAVGGHSARRVVLEASNDANFGEVHARLGELRDAAAVVTALAGR